MAEPFLSAALQVLFDRLASRELLQFVRQEGLGKQLDKWGETLTRIRKVLDDAEEKQLTERTVKDWLDDLRDLAYDVEDILDEFTTEAALRRNKSHASTSSQVRNLIRSSFTALTPSAPRINSRLESKMKEITSRFNDLMIQRDQLNLKDNCSMRPSKRRDIRPPSTSLVAKDHIYGREKVAEAILELLTTEKQSDALNKLVPNVIPIVGMGGIGKTTLAQLVFNNKKVESIFDLKAWTFVSDFDVVAVTKTILQSLTLEENCDGKDLIWLQEKLTEKLLGKRFLVILDDVWNENYHDWVLLRRPFEAGAPGSSIIVTTRNRRAASLMGTATVQPFQLDLLSNEACLSIFSQNALDAIDFSAYPDLKDIGEELVSRCKGLPLAVKTIGGLLRTTQDCGDWKKVLNNKIWDIPVERSGIPPALMLSYHNLPSHLKRCFAYCSILSKDYEFEEKQVVLLWMAEGLIQLRQDDEEMEDLGSEYFRNLLSRSFFQQSRINESRFLMHDLIHDLAQTVAGDTCFRMEDWAGSSNYENIPIKARHSSYLGSKYDVAKKFESFSKLTSLHTFLPLMLPYPGNCYLTRHVPLTLVPTLQCLRVLSFNGYYITKLSDSIGDLKHLRYLDLSRTRIKIMPKSITALYNLQTLLLEKCSRLKKLPSKLWKLVNLRHLNIEGSNSLEEMPVQIGKLTCLQTMTNFILGEENCSGANQLGPLKHLRGALRISRLENMIDPKDAKDAELTTKTRISALSLEWSKDIHKWKDRGSEHQEIILNGLRPHDALAELIIRYYGGTNFPIWLTSPLFPHMVSLALENCYKCTALPPFGQLPSLKILLIEGMSSVKNFGPEFCGDGSSQCFKSLETLSFKNMKEWEYWSPCQEFPNLRELSLVLCPKLSGKLPNNLPLLNKIEINDCRQLVVSVSSFPDQCKIVIDDFSEGMVCGSNLVTFKSIRFDSVHTISELTRRIEGFDQVEGLAELEDLSIERCEEVTHLWSDDVGLLPRLPFLGVLNIKNCDKLVSLVAEDQVEEPLQLCMPSKLTRLTIYNCRALESLPEEMMRNNMRHLEFIQITGCDSLTHFARSQLPPTLKQLYIWDCKNIRKLVEDDTNYSCSSTPSLESLSILNCPSLEYLTSSGVLPDSLRDLNISKCPKLESGVERFHHDLYLESIVISDCENLKFFNEVDLLPPNLTVLEISSCEKLQALPNGINNLTSLRSLKIWNCQGIQSFPVEGFPTNLTTLAITNLKITDALLDWGLDKLTFLKELHIGGYQQKSFPEFKLPAFLTSLHISNCPNLELLDSLGFRKLGFLKDLIISECKKLTSFPKNGLPRSLLTLDINSCQKLMSFPQNGLPPTLEKLRIMGCPLLEECCKKGGSEWSKIADIPYVEVSNKFIYDSETEE